MKTRRIFYQVVVWSALLLAGVAATSGRVPAADETAVLRSGARSRALLRAETAPRLLPQAVEDSVLAAEFVLPAAQKMGRWARRFAAADSVVYLFGPKPGGYVATGSLVDDRHHDCVSLLYRVSELARARDGRDAVSWALRTRFAGATPEVVVGDNGQVDYDNPAHLDFSLDMIRSGWWGRDVTDRLTGARVDAVGTSRYPPESFKLVPKAALVAAELTEGDVVWFVLDPDHHKGAQLRQKYGLVIGHIGLVVVDDGEPVLVHAAQSDLSGFYQGGTVVTVPLVEYLARVDKFAGVIVTRF